MGYIIVLVAETIIPYEVKRIGLDKQNTFQRGENGSISLRLQNRLKHHKSWSFISPISNEKVKVHFGSLLSGEKLIDNLKFRNEVLLENPTAIGGEMEGYGVYTAAKSENVEWVVIKSICDFADGSKGQNKKEKQKIAAKSAVGFVSDLFNQDVIFDDFGLVKRKKNINL